MESVDQLVGGLRQLLVEKISITDRKTGNAVIRYQVTVDAGINPETG